MEERTGFTTSLSIFAVEFIHYEKLLCFVFVFLLSNQVLVLVFFSSQVLARVHSRICKHKLNLSFVEC